MHNIKRMAIFCYADTTIGYTPEQKAIQISAHSSKLRGKMVVPEIGISTETTKQLLVAIIGRRSSYYGTYNFLVHQFYCRLFELQTILNLSVQRNAPSDGGAIK